MSERIAKSSGARTSLVTGGTGGIGRAVALALAQHGDRVIIVGRDRARAAEVLAGLRVANPSASHAFLPADLSLLSETARVSKEVLALAPQLDAAVLCAGILSAVPEWTREDLERNLALNYLSRYLMARLVLPRLLEGPSGRLVLVANAGQYQDTLDFDDLQHRRGKRGLHVAGRTQFANDLFATELAARVVRTALEVSCVFPGMVKTDVFRNARGFGWPMRALGAVLQLIAANSPEVAARTPVYLAQSPDARGTNGRFFGPNLRPIEVPERALRAERRNALWEASEMLVAPHLPLDPTQRSAVCPATQAR